MRLLHVTHQYWPALGGSERYMTDLSEELALRGHAVDVFTTRSRDYRTWHSELPSFERVGGVNVHRFGSIERGPLAWRALHYGLSRYHRTGARRYEPFILWGNGPLSPRLFLNVLWKARRYDLVHLNLLHYAHAAYGYWAAKSRGLPVAVTPHIHVEQEETYGAGYLQDILRGSDLVLADTRAEKRFLESLGVPGHRIVVAGIGVRLEDFPILDRAACRRRWGLPPDAFAMLFLGRKTEYKGLAPLLEAFLALRREHDQLHWLVLGPETAYSERLFAPYDDFPGLLRRGVISEEEKAEALNACDLLAMPSVGEAFGIVYLEAWALGKPVIGARAGAIPTIIAHEQDGILVSPGSVEELVREIERMMADPSRGQRLGARGQRKVRERYTTRHVADIVEGACTRLLRQRSNRRLQEVER